MQISLSELRDGLKRLSGCEDIIGFCVTGIGNASSVSTGGFTSSCENYSSNLFSYLSTISELRSKISTLRDEYKDFYDNANSVFKNLLLLCGYSDLDLNDLDNFVFNGNSFINDFTLFSENGNDGIVMVENGIFYLPDDSLNGTDDARGSGEYGYNIFFKKRLDALLKDVNTYFGGEILACSNSNNLGGFRSLEKQQEAVDRFGSFANPVGKSDHGWGIATDLEKASGNVSDIVASKALKWCKEHCKDYGLEFPYSKEGWHIQIPLDSIVRNNQKNATNKSTPSHNNAIEKDINSSSEDIYVVQSGQSLNSIANELGMTWEELYNKNKDTISNPNSIYPGQELKY